MSVKKLLSEAILKTVNGKKGRRQNRFKIIDGIKQKGKYVETKRLAEDRIKWMIRTA